jgi:hypothetical protein
VSHAHLSLRGGTQARLPLFRRSRAQNYLAFACAIRSELEEWDRQLNKLGIPNGGIVDAPYGSGLSFRDPEAVSGRAAQIPVQRITALIAGSA